MKNLLSFIAISFSLTASAQITLEHTYTNTSSIQVFYLDSEGHKYVGIDTGTKEVIIYNDNHTVWKTVNTVLPPNSNIHTVSCVSKKFFDNDGQVELVYTYITSGSPLTWTSVVYNEDGTQIATLPNVSGTAPVKVNNAWKLIGYSHTGTKIYSVPGQWEVGIAPPGGDDKEVGSMIFPNPFEQSATIRYTLPPGVHQAELSVYDTNGQKLRSYRVTDQFNDISLNRDDLAAGTYFYRVTAAGVEQNATKFVIH